MEIPHEFFAARRSIHAILKVDHVTHLGGISPPDCQTMPCRRADNMAWSEILDLACQGLTCFSPDCAFWLLDMEEDGPLNVYAVFRGFLPMLTVQELPFENALVW